MKIGDKVRMRPAGASVFEVVSIDEAEQTAVIESVVDAPGRYPFPVRLADLLGAES